MSDTTEFTRAWVNLDKLPGGMMVANGEKYGPVPASTSCWITTSENEAERLRGKGPVLEIFTHPAPIAPTASALPAEWEMEWPEYSYQDMGCGLEDRGIVYRYDAMRYGWDEAMEQVACVLANQTLYTVAPAEEASGDARPVSSISDDWIDVQVSGFKSLIAALERAEDKGYMPDALKEEWAKFQFMAWPAAPIAPAADAQPIPPIFYNGDTKRDPEFAKRVNAALTEKVIADAGACREGFEQQRKVGINVDWFTWQIAWHDAMFTQVDTAPSPKAPAAEAEDDVSDGELIADLIEQNRTLRARLDYAQAARILELERALAASDRSEGK